MAGRVGKIMAMTLALGMLAWAAGCGVKLPPVTRESVSPKRVTDLKTEVVPQGVAVTFSVPSAPTPKRAVDEVRLYYGYLPLGGDPDCPPCPPRLRKFHTFDLSKNATPQKLMDGGKFKYVDTAAPMNMQAVYQVVLFDASGRPSPISTPVRAPRVAPAAAPGGLTTQAGDGQVTVLWEQVTALTNGEAISDVAGYVVVRQGPEGEKTLNERPLEEPKLVDKTVANGATYKYRVHAVRQVGEAQLTGQASDWAEAAPRDMAPPSVPTDLAGVSQAEAIYLRFTPSPEKDTAGYLVHRAAADGQWVRVTQESVRENFYIDGDVEAGEVYQYKVQAVDEAGNISEFSEVYEIKYQP